MPNVSVLLRTTRLAQVGAPSVKNKLRFTLRGAHYPTHQIIETKPNSLIKDDWGLKNSIPKQKRDNGTHYMVVNKLDSLERMTDFEYNGGAQWNRIRFQEMGVVPTYGLGKSNPWFNFEANKMCREDGSIKNSGIVGDSQLRMISQAMGVGSSNQQHRNSHMSENKAQRQEKVRLRQKSQLLQSYRKEFKNWLLINYPESLMYKRFNSLELKDKAYEFLTSKHPNSQNQTNPPIIGSGGLSYGVKGRLTMTPHGIKRKNIAPGRILSNPVGNSSYNYYNNNINNRDRAINSNMDACAIGGFTGFANFQDKAKISYGMNSFLRELVLPFEIDGVTMENNGKIHMTASTISVLKPRGRNRIDNNYNRYGMNNNRHNNNARFTTNGNFSRRQNSKDDVNDLLFALENTGKDK